MITEDLIQIVSDLNNEAGYKDDELWYFKIEGYVDSIGFAGLELWNDQGEDLGHNKIVAKGYLKQLLKEKSYIFIKNAKI